MICVSVMYIIVTNISDISWVLVCLKSPAAELFALRFVYANIKHQSFTPLCFCKGKQSVASLFSSQGPINEESVSRLSVIGSTLSLLALG